MIPFHSIYSWLFKSFKIAGETELVERLIAEGNTRIMIIKRSWVFALFSIWIPIVIFVLSALSVWIASVSIEIDYIRTTIIAGNILMAVILLFSSWNYIRHFRELQMYSMITDDLNDLKKNLERGDRYFINYFDASVTNQFILIVTIVSEIVLIFLYQKSLGQHFWILATDTLVMIIEIMFLKMYRKRMIDLEMDYSVVIAGKIYFVNQSGVLSSIQTIESKKIKTIRSVFPNRIASIFDYGTIDILTEGDTQNLMGSLNMYYVNNPDAVVANIQSLIERPRHEGKGGQTVEDSQSESDMPPSASESIEHTLDTKGKVKEVLE